MKKPKLPGSNDPERRTMSPGYFLRKTALNQLASGLWVQI
jgi:hypothetical protein